MILKEREPWRIDKDSVHFKVLKGWLSERFKLWLILTGEQHKLSEDELLTRIIETIRRISWKTFEILKEKTGKEVNLPFIIISDNPINLVALKAGIQLDNNPDFFCNLDLVRKKLSFAYISIALEGFAQSFAEIGGGLVQQGCADEFGIAVYDRLIMNLFKMNLFRKFKARNKKNFFEVIIEEAFHYFCRQRDKFSHREMIQERLERVKNLDPLQRRKVSQEIEKKYEVKQRVNELIQILEQENEDLFSLLSLKQ